MQELFEHEFAERAGARNAIAVSSGTAGLHLSLLAAGIGEGDLVLTTPLSFIASANVILYERAVPLFVDIDPKTLMLDVDQALDAIRRRRPKAILPVHLFGQALEMRQIVDAAREHGVAVIEDACESIGASIDGRAAGCWGDAGVFAFYPNKQMTTGEGGMVVTDRDAWAATVRSLRNHGRDEHGEFARLGYNYRLDEMSSALGLSQLRRLDAKLARRAAVAAMYIEQLANIDCITPLPAPRAGAEMSWFVFVVRVAEGIDRDELMLRLADHGVPTRAYFPAIHLQPHYRRFGFKRGDFPHAEAAGDSLLALPFHANLGGEEIGYICEVLAEELEPCAPAIMRPSSGR
jgi:perosamine synthetase